MGLVLFCHCCYCTVLHIATKPVRPGPTGRIVGLICEAETFNRTRGRVPGLLSFV